jgi:hypothetical protein
MFRTGIIVIVAIMTVFCGYAYPQAPHFAFISPAVGLQGSTVNLTFSGSGFTATSRIVFSDSAIVVQSVRHVSPSALEATVVLSARAGTYSVRVSDSAGGASGAQWFSIVPAAAGSAAQLDVVAFRGQGPTLFDGPYKAWADAGYLYTTDYSHSTVSRISLSSGFVTTLAGSRDRFGAADGVGEQARFGFPAGIWSDGASVFVTDAYFDTVRRISLTTGEVVTIAGSPAGASGASDGIGGAARFRSPNGIWGDGPNLYICDRLNFTIRKLVIATGRVTTLAGQAQSRGTADGVGLAALFHAPTDLWGDGTYLYVADGNAIRKITIASGEVRTLAGQTGRPDYSDVRGPNAGFSYIGGVWGDGSSLYVADTGNNAIRKVSLDTGSVVTIAGSALEAGSDDGLGSGATFHNPSDIVGDGTGFYIVDSRNGAIRRAMPPSISEMTFRIQDRAGSALTTTGSKSTLQVGYAKLVLEGGSSSPSGIALFSYRPDGVLLFETAVAASRKIQSGRIPVEVQGGVNTGMAIANPGDTPVSVQFYFTDAGGANLHSGSLSLPANSQVAAFLDQSPFAPPESVVLKAVRSFSFNSSSPIGVTALRGFTNERSEFIMTTLPIAALNSTDASPIVFPHFADGGGWKSEIVLVNPTEAPLSGTVEFFTQVEPNGPGSAVSIVINGLSSNRFAYNIAPRSTIRMRTAGDGAALRTGWARVVPAGEMVTPAGLLVFSLQNDGVTISEAGVLALRETSAFRLYAEASGPFHLGEPGSIQSGVAISNSAPVPSSVRLELLALDGSPTGLASNRTLPPMGQVSMFLNQIPGFEKLQTPFRGFLRISGAQVAVTGLRARYNERRDFLFTSTPPIVEGALSFGELVFPHLADGGGYTTQFILYGDSVGQSANGAIRFLGQTGNALPLSISN